MNESKQKMIIYLARHAEAEWNALHLYMGKTDRPLTKRGIGQAKQMADELRDIPFAAIFSSDMSRSVDTARAIAAGRGLEVVMTPLLRERDFGVFEGRSSEDVHREYKDRFKELEKLKGKERIFFSLDPSIENDNSLVKRFYQFLRSFASSYSGQNILVVSHGSIIRAFLASIDEKYFAVTQIENTAYAVVETDGQNFEIKRDKGLHYPG